MTEERALKIALALQNIGYKVDDETLQKVKPFKDEIEAEILQEIENDKSASAEAYNKALDDLVQKLAEIDPCEFASFTLCLVREKADELKKGDK